MEIANWSSQKDKNPQEDARTILNLIVDESKQKWLLKHQSVTPRKTSFKILNGSTSNFDTRNTNYTSKAYVVFWLVIWLKFQNEIWIYSHALSFQSYIWDYLCYINKFSTISFQLHMPKSTKIIIQTSNHTTVWTCLVGVNLVWKNKFHISLPCLVRKVDERDVKINGKSHIYFFWQKGKTNTRGMAFAFPCWITEGW